MIEVTITPLERGDHVDVVVIASQAEISGFVERVDFGARYQRVDVGGDRELELGKLVHVGSIEFRKDGRWQLALRTPAAEVVKRLPVGSTQRSEK